MRPLLNAPFGACFELDAKSEALMRCDPAKVELDDGDDDEGEAGGDGGGEGEEDDGEKGELPAAKGGGGDPANELRNNASLQDGHGAAQRLQHDAIDALRRSGASGSEVVAALVAGSATFASKTALSQQKWVRRKVRKHVVRVSIRRPSAAALAAHAARGRGGTSSNGGSSSHTGGNAAIGCLRPEGVALLLNLGGVGPGAKVLVVDGVGGLLAASVAERLGGHGLAVVAFGGGGGGGGGGGNARMRGDGGSTNSSSKRGRNSSSSSSSAPSFSSPPQLDSLRHVDISQAARDAVVTAPLASLLEAAAEAREGEKGAQGAGGGTEGEAGEETERDSEGGGTKEEKAAAPAAAVVKDPAGAERAAAKKAAGARRQRSARAAAARGFDAFVCAAPALDPRSLLLRVAPLLAPSASFAMHVAWLQPAAELASAAMEGVSATKSCPSDSGGGGGGGDRGGRGGGRDERGGEGAAEDEAAAARAEAATPFAAAAVHLVEPWLRRYQVLPRRTHPEMWASGTGGYLVHGVSLPEGGAASCGGARAAAAAAAAAAERKAAAAAAGAGAGAGAGAAAAAKAAPSPAAAEEEKRNGTAASADDEYDPELSD